MNHRKRESDVNKDTMPAWLMVLAALTASASGCGSAHSVASDCPAERPALSSCYRGAQFADCGGEGTPRFGCAEGLDCRWFTGGCVAAEYVAWSCSDGQICCDDGAGPAYPTDVSTAPAWFFNANGSTPWTRERALDLVVEVDPDVTGELSVTCQRDGAPEVDVYPCRVPGTGNTESMNRYTIYARMLDTLSVSIQQTDGFVGVRVQVEIMPAEGLARACRLSTSDGIVVSCEPGDYYDGECATTGTVSISRLPARDEADLNGVVLAGELSFPSGLDMVFNVPL